jgi:anti-sigma B factor antagonist
LADSIQPFLIAERKLEGGRTLLAISGELDLARVPELKEQFAAIGDPRAGVVVDMREATFVDSSAIATLVELWKRTNTVQPSRISLVLSPGSQPEKVLKLVGLLECIPSYSEIPPAVEALG